MERVRFSEMQPGGVYQTLMMVRDVTEKKDKNGRSYLVLRMSDGAGEGDLFLWEATADSCPVKPGAVLNVTVAASRYNDRISYNMKAYTVAEGVSPTEFIPTSPVPPEDLYRECMAAVDSIREPGLREITRAIYTDYREKLLWWSAAKSVHHNRPGELLWHVTRMMRMAEAAAAAYKVNRGLLIAGVLLHDIGKLSELSTTNLGVTDYTVAGELCGHAYLGSEMVRIYGQKLGTPQESVRMLVHIILSHHGQPEFGAVARPSTAEAALVHYLDLLDSHIYIYEREGERLAEGEATEPIYFLDGARVYRPKELG